MNTPPEPQPSEPPQYGPAPNETAPVEPALDETPKPRREPVIEVVDAIVAEILRKMTPQQRLAQAFRMWESARIMVRAAIRQQHPDWTEEQVLREAANRLSHGATERVPR